MNKSREIAVTIWLNLGERGYAAIMIRMKLKEILQEKHISMSKLSRLSDLSFSTISRIINDEKYSPTLNTLERIARALHVEVSDLYEQVPDE